MGCCQSKEEHDEDDVHTPLLGNEVQNDSRMNYSSHEPIDVKQEQEFWKDVIDRTTQNLIDISSSQAEPLQEQDIQERTEKYRDLVGHVGQSNVQTNTTAKRPWSYHKVNGMNGNLSNVLAANGANDSVASATVTSSSAAILTTMTANTTSAATGGGGASETVGGAPTTIATTAAVGPFTGFDSSTDALISAAQSSEGLSQEQKEWLDQAVVDIQRALEKIQVQPVGDMVIHLTMPDSIQSH